MVFKTKYLEKIDLLEIDQLREKIYQIREDAIKKYNIDILDTDILSSISVYNIVSKYDKEYNVNLARNGEDGHSGNIKDIETKSTKIDGYIESGKFIRSNYQSEKEKFTKVRNKETAIAKRDAGFQFHVMGDISHEAYIFTVSMKSNLTLLRLYDIRDPQNVKKVNDHLLSLKNEYLKKSGGIVKKNDLVIVYEKWILDNITNMQKTIIDGCEVLRDV